MRAGSANGGRVLLFLLFLVTFLPGMASECQYYTSFRSQNCVTHYIFVFVFGGLSDKHFRLEHFDEKLCI